MTLADNVVAVKTELDALKAEVDQLQAAIVSLQSKGVSTDLTPALTAVSSLQADVDAKLAVITTQVTETPPATPAPTA